MTDINDSGYPIRDEHLIADFDEMLELELDPASAKWVLGVAYGDEQELGETSFGIADDNERFVGARLSNVVETYKQHYIDNPSEAEWIAEDLRRIANTLSSYTQYASRCLSCGELYNPHAVDHGDWCANSLSNRSVAQ